MSIFLLLHFWATTTTLCQKLTTKSSTKSFKLILYSRFVTNKLFENNIPTLQQGNRIVQWRSCPYRWPIVDTLVLKKAFSWCFFFFGGNINYCGFHVWFWQENSHVYYRNHCHSWRYLNLSSNKVIKKHILRVTTNGEMCRITWKTEATDGRKRARRLPKTNEHAEMPERIPNADVRRCFATLSA